MLGINFKGLLLVDLEKRHINLKDKGMTLIKINGRIVSFQSNTTGLAVELINIIA